MVFEVPFWAQEEAAAAAAVLLASLLPQVWAVILCKTW